MIPSPRLCVIDKSSPQYKRKDLFERLIENYLDDVPASYPFFRRSIPLWVHEKLHVAKRIRKALPDFNHQIAFTDHHFARLGSTTTPAFRRWDGWNRDSTLLVSPIGGVAWPARPQTNWTQRQNLV